MIPSLSPRQGEWLTQHANAAARALSPDEAAAIDAARGLLLPRGGMTILVGQDRQEQRRWILGARSHGPVEPWIRTRTFPGVHPNLWPALDHAVLLDTSVELPAHQRLAAMGLTIALDYTPQPPWPTLVAVGAPGALLLFGAPNAHAVLTGAPKDEYSSAMPTLLAVLPPP